MKKLFIVLLLIGYVFSCFSATVDENRAIKIATSCISAFQKSFVFMGIEKQIQGESSFYIVKFNPTGFVIVSGDDRFFPVLYYSTESVYDANNIPPGFKMMMESYGEQLNYAIKNYTTSTDEVKKLWIKYENAETAFQKTNNVTEVLPLIQTKWHQTYPYNKYCPAVTSGGSRGRAYAGCEAVALAQFLKYYEKPEYGKGSFSYNLSGLGIISADFANTRYNWINVVNTLSNENDTSKINETASLIYQAGVAVYTEYSGISSDAAFIMAYNALSDYFYYTSGSGISKNSKNNTGVAYTDDEWLTLLKSELNNSRPILYRASDNNGGGGHVFLLDGYDSNDYLHVNWGWGGSFDGYYISTALAPGGFNFCNGSQIIIGVKPLTASISIGYPTNGSIGVIKDCTISWSYTFGNKNTQYKLIIAADSAMSDVKVNKLITGDQFYKTVDLDYNTKYYFKVGAFTDNNGSTILWSNMNAFSTESDFSIKYPANGSKGIAKICSLSWDYKYGNANTQYRLLISTTVDMNSLITNELITSVQSYQTNNLDYNTIYFWKVGVYLNYNEILWSNITSFTTLDLNSYKLYLAYPQTNSTNIGLSPYFSWYKSILQPSYKITKIQISTDLSFLNIIFQHETTEYSYNYTEKLNYNQTYYWRVGLVYYDYPTIIWSYTSNFSTINLNENKPRCSSPKNNDKNILLPVTLNWSVETLYKTIQIQVAADPIFSNIIFQKDTAKCSSCTINNLNYNHAYYWRVGVVIENYDYIVWSDVFSFSTFHDPLEINSNYPNPFNATTTIKFKLYENGFLCCKIYNYLGQEVETLVDENLIPSEYSCTWIPRNCASGVYYCKIKFNDTEKIIKMNYLK
jgi:hypothetical protein